MTAVSRDRGAIFAALLALVCACRDPPQRARRKAEPARDAAAMPSGFACYLRARHDTTLDESERIHLCRGATSTAPVECVVRASDVPMLSTEQAIELCQCATSVGSIRCFTELRDNTFLDLQTLLDTCRPTATLRLSEGCTPIE